MESNPNPWTARIVSVVIAVLAFYGVRSCVAEQRKNRAYDKVAQSIQQGTVLQDAGLETSDPYEFFRKAHEQGGSLFRKTFAQGAEMSMRRNVPGAVLQFDRSAEVADLGSAIRGIVRYHGQMPVEGAGVHAVVGELRQYFHPTGAVTLEALCFTNLATCTNLSAFAGQAERQLLPQLGATGVGEMLPASGDCSIESVTNPVTGSFSNVASCWYEPAIALSLTRLDAAETRQALQSVAQDPELKQIMQEAAREATK